MKRIIVLLLSLLGLYQSAVAWGELSSKDIENIYGKLAFKAGTHCGIRRILMHTPAELESKQPLVLIVVHGTYASESPEYIDSFFTRVQVCAQQLACMRKAPVRIIYYRWSGFNTPLARKEAGELLAQVIDKHEGFEIITVAHSHGGNVVNYASNKTATPIGLMVHYAVPIIFDDETYKPNNVKLLCNFYSLTDIIQLIGARSVKSALKESIKSPTLATLTSTREYSSQTVGPNAGRIVNIRTRFHGYETDHSSIKNAIVVLPHILESLSDQYLFHNELELNVDVKQKDHPVLLMARTEKTDSPEASNEVTHSISQKELYKKLYGREIGVTQARLSYLSNVLANTLLLVPSIRALCQGYSFDKFMPHISHINF